MDTDRRRHVRRFWYGMAGYVVAIAAGAFLYAAGVFIGQRRYS